ncbi:MAG: hypothetical protein ACXVQX_08490, partial [Actinomycetota bacterium]
FYTWVSRTATSGYATETNISTLLNLAAGDYVEVSMNQNTGGTISTCYTNPYTWFAMDWVSP